MSCVLLSIYRVFMVIALIFCLLSMAHGQPSQNQNNTGDKSSVQKLDKDELAKVVAKLASELDDDKKAVRDAAEKKLLELGPPIMEYLPPTTSEASEEWNMRIERIRESAGKLENAEFTTPSLVTLTGEMTGREAIAKISQQTGNVIAMGELPNLDREVTADFEATPFWEAFDEVLDQLELTVAGGDGENIQLIPRAQNAPLRIATAGYAGVFRIEPLTVQKTLQLQDPGRSTLQFIVLVSWEPRLNPVFVKFPKESMELTCDDGQILQGVDSNEEDEFIPSGGSQLQVSLDFNLPDRRAKKVTRWTGKLDVTIPGRSATVEFNDLMNANKKETTVGNLSVVLEKARKNRDIYEVLVALKLKGDSQNVESFRGWANSHEAYLLDANKAKVENVGWSTTRMLESEIGLSYLFDLEKGLENHKFVVRAPANIVDQTVEFSLDDVLLP